MWTRSEANSFMMKHFIESHMDKEKEEVVFRFQIMKHFRTAFERQIYEAVEIKKSRGDPGKINLNSKCEYTRCILPDIRDEVMDELEEEEIKEKIRAYKATHPPRPKRKPGRLCTQTGVARSKRHKLEETQISSLSLQGVCPAPPSTNQCPALGGGQGPVSEVSPLDIVFEWNPIPLSSCNWEEAWSRIQEG